MLPFTSAYGEAVCSVIIFHSDQHDEVPIDCKSGIDITVDPVLDEYRKLYYNLNIVEGTYYPGGPKFKYNGKEVDFLNFFLESGGITGKILVAILTCFDSIEFFLCV